MWFQSIPSGSVAAGNPAKVICSYDEFVARKKKELESVPSYKEDYTLRNPNFNDEMKKEMKDSLQKGRIGYVE